MNISERTTVKEALESSPSAVLIFMQHGVNPMDKCSSEYEYLTIEMAEERCSLSDVPGLIKALNQALGSNR